MKTFISFFIFVAWQLCFAAGDTNIIVMSEWSSPIALRNEQLHEKSIRGRLMIVQGMEPAYGGPPTTNGAMTFVELQNVTRNESRTCCDDIDVCFDVKNLSCELLDSTGKAIPKPTAGPWGGRGPFAPSWVKLPYNSTIRLFVNGGTIDPLTVYPSGAPWIHWSIASNDTNTYLLTGTLNLFTHTNLSIPPEFRKMFCTATLEFPKVRITTKQNRQ